MMQLLTPFLPLIFAFLMGLAMFVYAVLDGYDLGVGILTWRTSNAERDVMIASIGPFWDANETWLVLGVGILLVAFPEAHGVVLTNLYLPVAFMLIGLTLRGVAFDFRAKSRPQRKHLWDKAFFAGSLLTAFSQGVMLGSYILGFQDTWQATLFSITVGFCVCAGYTLIGASWLLMKTTGALQKRAARWARVCLWLTMCGIIIVSLATPSVSQRIWEKWFTMPNIFFLAPVPLLTWLLFLFLDRLMVTLPRKNDAQCWVPFVVTIALYALSFGGLAYSFFPYIIPDKMLITEAASAPQSLFIILIGALVVLPVLIGYTIFAYRVFWGKATELKYH